MKRYLIVLCLLIGAFLFSGCGNTVSLLTDSTKKFDSKQIDITQINTYQDLVETVKPAVVGISSIGTRYQSIGTGVCIKKGAYILTNNHVIENGGTINLYLSNGLTANATIVWTDTSSDLAMLKSSVDIPYLPMAESGSYKSGDEVIALGTPLDLAFKHSATKGIISATNRTISVDNDYGESTLYNLIQHDASINPGNSGGPLINMSGEVIGINTVKVTDAEGMGFAIPVDTFKPAIEKISANGSYQTTYMGVFGFDNQLKHIGSLTSGFYVQDIAKNSPAFDSGIQKGDVITKINGKNIDLARELKTALYQHEVGDNVMVTIKRGEEYKNVSVCLTKHPYCYTATKVISRI